MKSANKPCLGNAENAENAENLSTHFVLLMWMFSKSGFSIFSNFSIFSILTHSDSASGTKSNIEILLVLGNAEKKFQHFQHWHRVRLSARLINIDQKYYKRTQNALKSRVSAVCRDMHDAGTPFRKPVFSWRKPACGENLSSNQASKGFSDVLANLKQHDPQTEPDVPQRQSCSGAGYVPRVVALSDFEASSADRASKGYTTSNVTTS